MPLGDGTMDQPTNFGNLEEEAAFNMALALTEEPIKEAAEAFMAFMSDFPDSENLSLALYNAGQFFEKAGQNGRRTSSTSATSMTIRRRAIGLTLRSNALNYSGILELETAIDYFEKLYRFFPDNPNAKNALYNAANLRVGLDDHLGAAENYEEYARIIDDTKEAEDAYWQAVKQRVELSELEGLKYYDRYRRKFPTEKPMNVMESYYQVAKYYEENGPKNREEAAGEALKG